MKGKLFFVYGTLKKGYGNGDRILNTSKKISNGTTQDSFHLLDGGFPYMVVKQDDLSLPVYGQLFRVDDANVERRLDQLEGIDYGHYCRKIINVRKDDGELVEAHTYVASSQTAKGLDRLHMCPSMDTKEGKAYVWSR